VSDEMDEALESGLAVGIRGVARLAGITAVTVRQHLRNGTIPPPDGYLDGISPYWREDVITEWVASRARPGRPPAA